MTEAKTELLYTPSTWKHWSIGLYPKIVGDEFINTISKIRTLYISGFLGGGKTMLAYYLAAYAEANGWVDRIVSNIPSPLSVVADDIPDIRNSAVILDEAWQFLSTHSEAVSYGAALRKLGVLLLMPSVFPPSAVLSAFSAQRFLNGYIFGLPIWGYKYYLNYKSFKDKGTFWLVNPHLMAGWYDTEAYPAEDYGISRKLDNAVTALKIVTARKLGKTVKEKTNAIIQRNSANAEAVSQVAKNPALDTTALENVTERFEDVAEKIGDSIGKLTRRR